MLNLFLRKTKKCFMTTVLFLTTFVVYSNPPENPPSEKTTVSGKVLDKKGSPVAFATVFIKDSTHGTMADENGNYSLKIHLGSHILCASMLGYEDHEKEINVNAKTPTKIDFILSESSILLDNVVVTASGIERVKTSAFNTVAVDTRDMQNTTKNLSDALSKSPGMKLRESGGVGSDMSVMLNGFSGKHIKVFIDGVPQEGVGSSFSLNNIPVGFAERIEVYRGVVPVGFGSDAIGGVINIVTNKKRRSWFADASYSYGSFNTHRSTINAGQSLENGFTWEINAFQNYSDNNYFVDAPVEDFETGLINKSKKQHVQRFNDTYHNEAVIAKIGLTNKKWTDRLILGFTYSQMYKEIQTGVRQEIVYGAKHRHGNSLMPSLEYVKRNFILPGLDLTLTANYNKNATTNVDTSQYKYNWIGDTKRLNSPGEQSYQFSRADNDNYNTTANLNYRIGHAHLFTLNNIFNAFTRSNTSLLAAEEQTDPIAKRTHKNITGFQYRLMPSHVWNVTVFAKYYNLYVSGPIAVDENASDFVETTRSENALGYGIAGTYFIIPELQTKLSYEKAYRLPTIEEMFGDEDLEMGDIGIRPENSHNFNLNISYNFFIDKKENHNIYIEGGLVYHDTRDYIQRNIVDISGGKSAATYINYGRVKTIGGNVSLRYTFSKWLSIGGNATYMDIRDNMPIAIGTESMPNLGYKDRMPNIPYFFTDADVTFTWNDFMKKDNDLSIIYDNSYLHKFYYYSSRIGSNKDDYMVPNQLSHNVSLNYSLKNGRYNLSVECRNLTNEDLYDNFSLQKAGRAFYAKVRVALGN